MNQNTMQTPPQNIKAEQALLGLILKHGTLIDDVSGKLKTDYFFNRNHQIIYQAMLELVKNDQKINYLTIGDYLSTHHQLNYVGGYQYLQNLVKNAPADDNSITSTAQIIMTKALYRYNIKFLQKGINDSYNQKLSVNDIGQKIENNIFKLSDAQNSKGLVPITKLMPPAIQHIEYLKMHHKSVTGLRTGFTGIDNMTTGLHPGEFIVIAARPAMGKTTLAMNIAQNVATYSGKAVAVFSLEMGAQSLVDRMICAGGAIDHEHLRTGYLTKSELNRMAVPLHNLLNGHLYIDDTPGINISTIMARARRLVKSGVHLGLIVIDYLQLVEGDDSDGRQQEVAGISRQLKKLAKALNIPVIALSQLSRGVEQREDKTPKLSDIRESGAIEQDADIIAFLYRKDYYNHDRQMKKLNETQRIKFKKAQAKKGDPSLTNFIIAKNRNGEDGQIKLMMFKAYNKFSSISKDTLTKLAQQHKS